MNVTTMNAFQVWPEMSEIENGMIKQLLQTVNDTERHQTVNTHHVQYTVNSPQYKLTLRSKIRIRKAFKQIAGWGETHSRKNQRF